MHSGKSGCNRAEVVVFGGKVVVLGQRWLYSERMVAIGQSGCNPAKVGVFGKSGCNRARWLHSGKVFVFGKSCFLFRQMWLYSG